MFTYTIVKNEDGETNVTVFVIGGALYTCDDSHPNYNKIREALVLEDEDADFESLFDLGAAASKRFEALSDRVSIKGGEVYLDGDKVDNALTQQITRYIEDDVEDWQSLVNFYENILSNPNEHSREQLYGWLANYKSFTITYDGYIVGYKGVKTDADGNRWSTSSGKAIVDGEEVTGYIPNEDSSTVEMPRSEVQHDPRSGCSTGLHVGTHNYARGYGNTLIEVHVNPRDVVSVPTDCSSQKMRVCRYVIVGPVTDEYSEPVLDNYIEDEDDFDDFPEGYGEGLSGPVPADGEYDDEDETSYVEVTDGEIEAMRVLAKARKRGFERFVRSQGWINLAENGNGAWVRPV